MSLIYTSIGSYRYRQHTSLGQRETKNTHPYAINNRFVIVRIMYTLCFHITLIITTLIGFPSGGIKHRHYDDGTGGVMRRRLCKLTQILFPFYLASKGHGALSMVGVFSSWSLLWFKFLWILESRPRLIRIDSNEMAYECHITAAITIVRNLGNCIQ